MYRIIIYAHAIHYCQKLNFSILFGLEDRKGFNYLRNCSEGVQYYPEFEVFDIFFIFRAMQNVCKIHSAS